MKTVLPVVLAAAAVIAVAAGRQVVPQVPSAAALRDLRGTIDIHVHADPDNVPRVHDAIEAVRRAKEAGMRAIVVKSHYDPTAGLAWLGRKYAPGIEVFGGIDLNLPVGGMNVHAVEHMTEVKGGWGRFVWMSTFDSENQVRVSKANRPFVRVAVNGALLPETRAVIAAIAKHALILASGHVSAQEAMLMFDEGKRAGVRHMVATHGMSSPTALSVEQARRAGDLGVFIEFTGDTMVAPTAPSRVDRIAEQIRQIGVDHSILSSDLGKGGAELPVEGLAAFIAALRKKGFSDQELDRMTRKNPAMLLGLE